MRHSDALTRWRSALDLLGPHRGPCGLCGGDDARHRQSDAIWEMLRAGELPEVVADEFGVSLPAALHVAWASTEVEASGRRQRIPQRHWWG